MPIDDSNWQNLPAIPETTTPGMVLNPSQQFEMVKLSRMIDSVNDVNELKLIARKLLEAWFTQKAATNWLISQSTGWNVSGLQNHPIDS